MDNERFAGFVRAMGNGASRRGALGVVAGIAGLSLGEVAARKKGRGKGESTGRTQGESTGRTQASVAVCHYDADTDTYSVINVSSKGWHNGHAKHEQDFLQGADGECCNDSGCAHLNDSCYSGVCDQTTGACRKVFIDGDACHNKSSRADQRTPDGYPRRPGWMLTLPHRRSGTR